MKSHEFITEITKIAASDYPGGKEDLPSKTPLSQTPLPGGSGLTYSITGRKGSQGIKIVIIDPKAAPVPPEQKSWESQGEFARRLARWKASDAKSPGLIIGELSLYKHRFPIAGAYRVSVINVNEDYRGMGIAKSLYGIALVILRVILVAGDSQTPGGRRNWLSLAGIPGVEVKGAAAIPDGTFGITKLPRGGQPGRDPEADAVIEKIMASGADYLGPVRVYSGVYHYFAFPVIGKGNELAPAIKKTFDVYSSNWHDDSELYAVWSGK